MNDLFCLFIYECDLYLIYPSMQEQPCKCFVSSQQQLLPIVNTILFLILCPLTPSLLLLPLTYLYLFSLLTSTQLWLSSEQAMNTESTCCECVVLRGVSFDVIFTCVADDEVSLLHVVCYGVFESESFQCDVWTAVSSWKERSSPNLKDQAFISTSLQSLRGKISYYETEFKNESLIG